MKQQYNNQFSSTKELEKILSTIISQKEKTNYLCKTLLVTIPEHTEAVLVSPLDNYNPWGGGIKALSGAQIQIINEKYGKYIEKTIPKKEYHFLIVMKKESYQFVSNLSFKRKEEAEKTLQSESIEYNGYFNASVFTQKFPYLEELFAALDKWRRDTGKIIIDEEAVQKTLKKFKNN